MKGERDSNSKTKKKSSMTDVEHYGRTLKFVFVQK